MQHTSFTFCYKIPERYLRLFQNINYVHEKMALIAVMYFALVLMLFPSVTIAQTGGSARTAVYNNNAEASLGKMAADILVLINEHRTALGLSKLVTSDAATKQATLHSVDMANGASAFGHDGFDDRMNAIMSTAGRLSESGENVASGQMSAKEVVEGWLNSKGHRKTSKVISLHWD